MLIFIENTPLSYAWGSTDALPEMLGTTPTGLPQAELWLGTHPGSPAHIAKATPAPHTIIDLVEADPELYGVDGGPLPFLLKVLAIGGPLSLQVHPNLAQAAAGFAAEEAAGVPRDAPHRNYGDANHKPELLVALSEVSALSGFRPLSAARDDLARYARAATLTHDLEGATALNAAARQLCPSATHSTDSDLRLAYLDWVFSEDPAVSQALATLARLAARQDPDHEAARTTEDETDDPTPRRGALRALLRTHVEDPGVLVALLLHHVQLQPGESIYLGTRQLHAYLGGIAVEVMAASDNVLRAGLTQKHIDVAELRRVLDPTELDEPRIAPTRLAPGLDAWQPNIPDFQLVRARLCEPEDETGPIVHSGGALYTGPIAQVAQAGAGALEGAARTVKISVPQPAVLMVTQGRVRIERVDAAGVAVGDPGVIEGTGAASAVASGVAEVAQARRGQSLYVSAGEPIELTGHGEVFFATVGGISLSPPRVN